METATPTPTDELPEFYEHSSTVELLFECDHDGDPRRLTRDLYAVVEDELERRGFRSEGGSWGSEGATGATQTRWRALVSETGHAANTRTTPTLSDVQNALAELTRFVDMFEEGAGCHDYRSGDYRTTCDDPYHDIFRDARRQLAIIAASLGASL